jgi:predicted transcriptional regulator
MSVPSKFDKIHLNREQDRRAKFTAEQVKEMRELYSKGYKQKEIAEIFKTRQSTVCYIVSDRARQHLAEYRKINPPKRRTTQESRKYARELRKYKKELALKGGEG